MCESVTKIYVGNSKDGNQQVKRRRISVVQSRHDDHKKKKMIKGMYKALKTAIQMGFQWASKGLLLGPKEVTYRRHHSSTPAKVRQQNWDSY